MSKKDQELPELPPNLRRFVGGEDEGALDDEIDDAERAEAAAAERRAEARAQERRHLRAEALRRAAKA